MSKTIVGTHADKNPYWQAWSKAAAVAENAIGTAYEVKRWAEADALWDVYQMDLETQKAEAIYQVARAAIQHPLSALEMQNERAAECATLDDYYNSLPAESGW